LAGYPLSEAQQVSDAPTVQIDFYHLMSADVATPLAMLADKVVATGHKLLILSRPEQFEPISSALWTHKPETFLAHNINDEAGAAHAPVWLSSQADANQINAEYIALTAGMQPPDLMKFRRIFNLFDGSDAHATQIARDCWKQWSALAEVQCRYFVQDENGKWTQRQ